MERIIQRLLRQHEVPAIGGVMWLVRQIAFYLSIVNFVMISRIFWDTSAIVRDLFFQNYWLFLFGGLGLIMFVASLIEYKLVAPSWFKFQQYQSMTIERSPVYKEVVEMRKEIAEIKKLLEEKK